MKSLLKKTLLLSAALSLSGVVTPLTLAEEGVAQTDVVVLEHLPEDIELPSTYEEFSAYLDQLDLSAYEEDSVHPMISAFFNRLKELPTKQDGFYSDQEWNYIELMSHSYIFESMMPGLPEVEKEGLATLRELIYVANDLMAPLRAEFYAQSASELADKSLNQVWQEQMEHWNTWSMQHLEEAHAIQLVANAKGFDPHVFYYTIEPAPAGYEGYADPIGHKIFGDMNLSYQVNPATQEVFNLDFKGDATAIPSSFNFEKEYGVAVENHFRSIQE
ncbi:hypothetical protein [Dolosicoccus paucivorans]|uniref:Uncharacterized protein n=1 Tax=Dolosicoccus paucivorans TaxID=84521 RepID=A0A1G8NX11_9LACT|nr:hypothetical protein [Dolosicoccus paucivorans]PMB83632.1 hypothetical protein CJ206_08110 [Dolosicoccus paucivorans]PMC58654.1 hypothetical protein CJ205_03005 [Dolosicoccus paucivorans]SDI84777.1 hypothetical protein SAMN04487994_10583 [Dolosicoccus paucivorans]